VTVVLCTAGRASLLQGCLTTLIKSLCEGDELLVVESGADGAAQVLDGLESRGVSLVHMRVEPPGKARQMNAGILAARSEILLFTDDDVRVPSTWPTDMAAAFDDPAVAMAFGPVIGLSRVPGTDQSTGPAPGEAPLATWGFAHGAAMAVRRSAALISGGFDERLGPGAKAHGEEHDLVLRMRQRGLRIAIAPADSVQHLDWRSDEENRANALVYERGGGAVVGAALRRSISAGWPVLRQRLVYQRSVFSWNRRFAPRALAAFAGGLLYGLRLRERNWLQPTD
jgi:GT2 family glycosyltransferase